MALPLRSRFLALTFAMLSACGGDDTPDVQLPDPGNGTAPALVASVERTVSSMPA